MKGIICQCKSCGYKLDTDICIEKAFTTVNWKSQKCFTYDKQTFVKVLRCIVSDGETRSSQWEN